MSGISAEWHEGACVCCDLHSQHRPSRTGCGSNATSGGGRGPAIVMLDLTSDDDEPTSAASAVAAFSSKAAAPREAGAGGKGCDKMLIEDDGKAGCAPV